MDVTSYSYVIFIQQYDDADYDFSVNSVNYSIVDNDVLYLLPLFTTTILLTVHSEYNLLT